MRQSVVRAKKEARTWAVVVLRKLAACGSRPPGYNSIQEVRRTRGPTQVGRVR